MKTIKQKFKATLILIVLLISVTIYGKTENKNNQLFVRVYNLEGKKIKKGKLISVSDTKLQLKRAKGVKSIDIKDIGKIKTKRSAGHNVLMGAAIGATTVSAISIASIDPNDSEFILDATPDTYGEAIVTGVIAGGFLGSAIGALTIPFKNSATFIINGDLSKFKIFKDTIDKR